MIPIWFIAWMILSFTWLGYESDWMRIRLPIYSVTTPQAKQSTPMQQPLPIAYCYMCHKNAIVYHYQHEEFAIGYPNLKQAYDYTVCEDCHTKIVKGFEQAQKPNGHKPNYPKGFDFFAWYDVIALNRCDYLINHCYSGPGRFTRVKAIEPICGWEWLERAWGELQSDGSKYYNQSMTVNYDGKQVSKFDIHTKAGEVKKLVKEIRSQHLETWLRYGKGKPLFLGSDLTKEEIAKL